MSIDFDGWLAYKQLDMLEITVHYLDEQLRMQTVLLGLKAMYRAHTSTAILKSCWRPCVGFKKRVHSMSGAKRLSFVGIGISRIFLNFLPL